MVGAYGVVLSGGGALGAWEVGCLRALLRHERGFSPRVICGASAGALNAAALAAGFLLDELQQVWDSLRPSSVYRAHPPDSSWLGLVTRVAIRTVRSRSFERGITGTLNNYPSLFDARPLEATLRAKFGPHWERLQHHQGVLALAS